MVMMEGDMMNCLEFLKADIAEIPDDNARMCLASFIDFCSALYACEADDEQTSRELEDICRRQIAKTHKKSVRVLEFLLQSDGLQKPCDINSVLGKMKELLGVSEQLDAQFGPAPMSLNRESLLQEPKEYVSNGLNSDPSSSGDKADANVLIREIVQGLEQLTSMALSLQETEKEVRTNNRELSFRLEALKQEAGSHPAIEAYTARNCHSPLAARARREEYTQYACALERVLKKIRKATDSFHSSNQSDLACLERHLPALKTLSQDLARLHLTTQEASGSPDRRSESLGLSQEPPGTDDKLASLWSQRLSCGQLVKAGTKLDGAGSDDDAPVCSEKLTKANATVGSMRRLVDASLGHVDALLVEPWGDKFAAQNSTSPAANIPPAKQDGGSLMSHWRPLSSGEDRLAIDTFRFLPLGEEECREHLVRGTTLLMSVIEDLERAIKEKSTITEAQAVLDNALCRPFPETSTLRLELISLLTSAEELQATQQSPPCQTNEQPCRPTSPKKSGGPSGRKSPNQRLLKKTQEQKTRSPEQTKRKNDGPPDRKRPNTEGFTEQIWAL